MAEESEDFLEDDTLVPRKRSRTNPRANRTSIGLSKKFIACPCAAHKGKPLRPDLYKRCQNQQRVRNIRPELQAPLPKHLINIPESSQREFRAVTTPESDPAQEDYGYYDTTLPPLPGEADGERIADGDPPDYPDGILDVESPPHPLDDGPQSRTLSSMSPRISSHLPSEAEDEPELDDDSDSHSWRTPTPDAPEHGLGVPMGILPLSELIPLPEFVPPHPSPNSSLQIGDDVQPDGDMQPEDDVPLDNDSLLSDHDAPPEGTTLPRAPDHVRFLELLALQLQTHYGLPKAGVEYLLKSFNWAFQHDGAFARWKQEQPDEDEEELVAGPLSQSLETLLKRVGIKSDGERYVVCPNMDCNILTRLRSLPRDTQTLCSCGTELMKQSWYTNKRGELRAVYKPVLLFAYHSLIKQLEKLLSRPDIIDAICRHKAHVQRPGRNPDIKEDIQHGRVWLELRGLDEQPFFTPEGDEIGLILTLDWFNSTTMVGARGRSTGVLAIAIANLPSELRWNPENLILVGTLPGPAETGTEQMCNYLQPLVDELLVLWNTPETRLDGDHVQSIKAALVLCICDSPAARKLSGTAGVAGTYFCTRCWCCKDDLDDLDKVHDCRTTQEHRTAAAMYVTLPERQRSKFLTRKAKPSAPGGYRPTCFLQLPYWDGARMIVVDPMHCLFLGVVKWQIKRIWLEFKHLREDHELELNLLHSIIESAQLPDFLGRPPPKTGTKEGGSLTSDQYRTLINVVFPIAVPVIWGGIDTKSAEQRSMEDYRRRRVDYERAVRERTELKRLLGGKVPDSKLPPLPDAPRMPRRSRKQNQNQPGPSTSTANPQIEPFYMADDPELQIHTSFQKNDDASIIDLAIAIANLTGRTISSEQQQRGIMHLGRYLRNFALARGIENMAPNHHLCTHITKQTEDYGPAPQMWAYGSERLNKITKSAHTNRHAGGEVEVAYANAHMRRQGLASQMRSIARDDSDGLHGWAQLPVRSTRFNRGTVEVSWGAPGTITASMQHSKRCLGPGEHEQVTRYLQRMFPDLQFRLLVRTLGDGLVVGQEVERYTYLVHAGRMFHANSQNGIVAAHVTWGNQAEQYTNAWFAQVRWYVDVTEAGLDLRPLRIWHYDA
ncbi:hypothetical protein FRC10_007954 [Ceratobasidium sp. 414]|nr:hypothetical protein FRC10_007954 [Ceratobasidium sp. 414]